jgi:hypothetical protein
MAGTGVSRRKGALDVDGLEDEFLDAGWNVAAAPFAGDHEGLA